MRDYWTKLTRLGASTPVMLTVLGVMIALTAYAANEYAIPQSVRDRAFILIKTDVFFKGFVFGAIIIAWLVVFGLAQFNLARRQRKRAEERAEQLDMVINNMSQGLSRYDRDGNLIMVNRRYLELYQLAPEQIRIGMNVRELLALRQQQGTFSEEIETFLNVMALQAAGGTASHVISKMPNGRAVVVTRRNTSDGGWIATHEDVTERQELEDKLQSTKNFLQSVLDHIPMVIGVREVNSGRYAMVNTASESYFGLRREMMISSAPSDIFDAEHAERIEQIDKEVVASNEDSHQIEYALKKGAETRLVTVRRRILRDRDGEPEFILSVLEDVTDAQKLSRQIEDSKKFLETIIDNIPVSITVKRASDRRYIACNRDAEKVMGLPRSRFIGLRAEEFLPEGAAKGIERQDEEAISARGEVLLGEYPLARPDSTIGLFSSRRVAILDGQGHPEYIVMTHVDITDRRKTESRLEHLAYHDGLTDLPNRPAFLNALQQMIDSSANEGNQFAILSVDLDRFKEINDVFGHAMGDKLLVEVSRVLQKASQGAVIARISGDEFGLIVDGPQPETGRALAEQLVDAMKQEFFVDNRSIRIGMTCGISVFPSDGKNATALLANADAALHRAKMEARGTVQFFEPQMDQLLRDRRALHHDLGGAVKNNELKLYFQPQADANHVFVGFEALVRWDHPVRGFVSPSDFIPVAEESGIIVEMGEWILRESCREAASWDKPLQIAVNLSPVQFLHGDLAQLVHSILLETGLSPERLELEITEGVLIRDFDRGLALLRRLKALGVKIAMDDFGSGYSSLTYLQAFPFDKIKIDRAFVMNLATSPQSAAIVRAVIGLGHGLDIPIVAEGVETQDQLAFLIQEQCDQFQGFYFGKPAPIAQYRDVVGVKPPAEAIAPREKQIASVSEPLREAI